MKPLFSLINANFDSTTNPFESIGTHAVLFDPEWIGYLLGSLILVIGLVTFFFYPKARDKAKKYKDSQLEAYNKKYNKNEKDYKRTGMYLPAGQRVMMFLPVVLGIVFCVIGIAFLTMQTLFSL